MIDTISLVIQLVASLATIVGLVLVWVYRYKIGYYTGWEDGLNEGVKAYHKSHPDLTEAKAGREFMTKRNPVAKSLRKDGQYASRVVRSKKAYHRAKTNAEDRRVVRDQAKQETPDNGSV